MFQLKVPQTRRKMTICKCLQKPLPDKTNDLTSSKFVKRRNCVIELKKVINFETLVEKLLKMFSFIFTGELGELRIKTLAAQHGITVESLKRRVASVNNVENFAIKPELFLHIVGQYCSVDGTQILISAKVFCCDDQLIPQLHELFQI